MAVRLFIGNLPYSATEADLRTHFAALAEPSHVVMPVDRETGRPRGFAFVEFTERAVAEEVIRKFDAQPFQGRNLAVSEARAREDRGPRPPGPAASAVPGLVGVAFSSPRPGGFGGGGGGGRFQPPARSGRSSVGRVDEIAPRTSGHRRRRSGSAARRAAQQNDRPRGPIKERSGGRIYAVDDLDDDKFDIDDVATAVDDDADTSVESSVESSDETTTERDDDTTSDRDDE